MIGQQADETKTYFQNNSRYCNDRRGAVSDVILNDRRYDARDSRHGNAGAADTAPYSECAVA